MIQVGQKVRFDPMAAIRSMAESPVYTVGTVAMVNAKHKWFSVKYDGNQRISFKFSEIGQNVFMSK